jgi:hypothetical protein
VTLLHTKGYSEVLESVKMRARKKARQFDSRNGVTVALGRLDGMATVAVELAREFDDRVVKLTPEETDELLLTFAEDFLHHYRYELDQIRSEQRAATVG